MYKKQLIATYEILRSFQKQLPLTVLNLLLEFFKKPALPPPKNSTIYLKLFCAMPEPYHNVIFKGKEIPSMKFMFV